MSAALMYLVPFALWLVSSYVLRSWRMGAEACLGGLVFAAASIWPVVLVTVLLGGNLGWIAAPLSICAGVFGRTPLGALNFSLLQWFGVRLVQSVDPADLADGRPGRWWSAHAPPRPTPVRFLVMRWVWPLTGWWSEYRWIERRGSVRA